MRKLINYTKILSVLLTVLLGGIIFGGEWGKRGGGRKGDESRPLPVPEPSSYILMLAGGITIVYLRFRSAKKKNSR